MLALLQRELAPALLSFGGVTTSLITAIHGGTEASLRTPNIFVEVYSGGMLWTPNSTHLNDSNLAITMRELGHASYESLHHWSVSDMPAFWEDTIERLGIVFERKFSAILEPRTWRWLPDAQLNITQSCFQNSNDFPKIIQSTEGRDPLTITTQAELQELVNRVSNGLIEAGFVSGDRIAIDMPMNSDAVAIYLGIVQAGMSVVSIADSFSAPEIQKRLCIADAKAIFTSDYTLRAGKKIPLYTKVCEAEAPRAIVLQHENSALRPTDIAWTDFLSKRRQFNAVPSAPNTETNVLFSSGTTGDPKAIPWTHLTPIKAASDGYYHQNIQPGDVVAMPTNLGWMMGPWLLYTTFINNGTLALYEGNPAGDHFAQFLQKAKVNILGIIPSLVRSWRQAKCLESVDLSAMKLFTSTGECSHPDDYSYLMQCTGMRAPIIEYCGGTEVGGAYLTSTVLHTQAASTFPALALGSDAVVVKGIDANGVAIPAAAGESGEAYLVSPAIGLSETLLNRDHDAVYYQGCPSGPNGETLRRHGDQLRVENGFYRHQGRADDTMNLGGIKVGSADLESVINRHPAVRESAAVAFHDKEGGPDQLLVFVVLTEEQELPDLQQALQKLLRSELNPLFKISELRSIVADEMPKTASGKIQRRLLRI